jgi:hypothetical protein
MSHQDRSCSLVINHQTLKQVIDWLLAPGVFTSLRGSRVATWKPRMLAAAALLWATSELPTLQDRFAQARKIVQKVFRWQPAPGLSAQGFLKMLSKWQPELLGAVVPHLREQMQEGQPEQWETAGYAVFAGDGTRVALARSESLERTFAPQRRRLRAASRTKARALRRVHKHQAAAARHKKATSPQLWLTVLWHVGSGLPWAWRTGPSGASERDQLVAMVPELPAHALLVADAGFVGYDLWQTLLTAGHHFVIRVGANVRLLRQLGWTREYAQVVYLWPDQAAQKRQPPLVLRLVVVQDGKQPVYLVTNLAKSRLSDRQVATIYGARWGVGVSREGFLTQSVQVRPRLKDSGLVAREAPGRESKPVKPSDTPLCKEWARRSRLQRTVNAEVASSHATPVAETVDNERRQQGPSETSLQRRSSPAGYQRRHGTKGERATGEVRGARRRKLAGEAWPLTVSGKWLGWPPDGGSGRSTDNPRAAKRAGREGPGPVGNLLSKERQG